MEEIVSGGQIQGCNLLQQTMRPTKDALLVETGFYPGTLACVGYPEPFSIRNNLVPIPLVFLFLFLIIHYSYSDYLAYDERSHPP